MIPFSEITKKKRKKIIQGKTSKNARKREKKFYIQGNTRAKDGITLVACSAGNLFANSSFRCSNWTKLFC